MMGTVLEVLLALMAFGLIVEAVLTVLGARRWGLVQARAQRERPAVPAVVSPVGLLAVVAADDAGRAREIVRRALDTALSYTGPVEVTFLLAGSPREQELLLAELGTRRLHGLRSDEAATVSLHALSSAAHVRVLLSGDLPTGAAIELAARSSSSPQLCIAEASQLPGEEALGALSRSLEGDACRTMAIVAPPALFAAPSTRVRTVSELRALAEERRAKFLWCGVGGPGPRALWLAPVLLQRRRLLEAELSDRGDLRSWIAALAQVTAADGSPVAVVSPGIAPTTSGERARPLWSPTAEGGFWPRLERALVLLPWLRLVGIALSVALLRVDAHVSWLGVAVLLGLVAPAAVRVLGELFLELSSRGGDPRSAVLRAVAALEPLIFRRRDAGSRA